MSVAKCTSPSVIKVKDIVSSLALAAGMSEGVGDIQTSLVNATLTGENLPLAVKEAILFCQSILI